MAIKIFSLLRSSAWKLVHLAGRKIAVDLFSVRRTDEVEAMAVLRKFDFCIGITIIVKTNKKVELFPRKGEVQAVIWIANGTNTFLLQNLLICFREQTEIFCYSPN